ncbi:esterase-like activity of phytase family protein [Streptomyces sp. NPDC047706]|uniref:esterase-like activity of phytase family protein n=1 Tax=Streptomyces sp. NPDC047706 TaxID=3365486 RepID=UPI00371B05D2
MRGPSILLGAALLTVAPASPAGAGDDCADGDFGRATLVADGTYWTGDEFGPFLLHFDASGRLLEAPIALDGVQAPENPCLDGGRTTLAGSKGFEGLVRSVDGRRFHPLLEGTVTGDTPGGLRFSEFDLRQRAYRGKRFVYHSFTSTAAPSNRPALRSASAWSARAMG